MFQVCLFYFKMGKGNKNKVGKKSKWKLFTEAAFNKKNWDTYWGGVMHVEDTLMDFVTRPFTHSSTNVFSMLFKKIGLPILLVVGAFGVGLYFLTTRNQAAIVATANAAGRFGVPI